MKDNKDRTMYLPIFMSLGLSVGMAIGAAFGNISIGMCMGIGIGVGIGALLDSVNKKAEGDGEDNNNSADGENGTDEHKEG